MKTYWRIPIKSSIRKKLILPEFDYLYLMGALDEYARPRDQVTKLLRSGEIIRVKKGVYVLGPSFEQPYSPYILANIVYGPSYVSGLSALSFYQFIPERVNDITSTCMTKNKKFCTPVGDFIYSYLNPAKYCLSLKSEQISSKRSFLIASPEKTFVELLIKNKNIQMFEDVLEWIETMRIEREDLKKLRITEIQKLQTVFKKKQIDLFLDLIVEIKQNA